MTLLLKAAISSSMRTQNYFRLIAVLFAFTVIPAHAADDKGLYQTLNYISCAQYIEDRKLPLHTGRNAADEIYVSGWLSAYNYLTPNTYDVVPGHDIMKVLEWMDTFCKDNSDKSVEAGLLQFSSDSYPDRVQHYPKPAK